MKSEWFLVDYPCQGGCSEGGRGLALLWLHDRSRHKRSCFVPYIVDALENKVVKCHRAGHVYSEGHLRNNLYISPLNFAVPSRNKKGEEYGDFWAY